MTETRERRITFDELRYVLVACQTCAAEITIDLENEYQAKALAGPGAGIPVPSCPICASPFNTAVVTAVHDFAQWAGSLRKAGQSIAFRLREPQAVAAPGEGGR